MLKTQRIEARYNSAPAQNGPILTALFLSSQTKELSRTSVRTKWARPTTEQSRCAQHKMTTGYKWIAWLPWSGQKSVTSARTRLKNKFRSCWCFGPHAVTQSWDARYCQTPKPLLSLSLSLWLPVRHVWSPWGNFQWPNGVPTLPLWLSISFVKRIYLQKKKRLYRKDSTFQSCCFGSACPFPALFDGLNAFRWTRHR